MNWLNYQLIGESLEELSDRSIQERRWLSAGGRDVSSFVEAASQLFDDSGLGGMLDRGESPLGKDADALMRELGEYLTQIDSSRSPRTIIDDPTMNAVRDLAAKARQLIQSRTDNRHE